MSNALAIAAATATLRNLIIRGVPDLPDNNVTTLPPDKAVNGTTTRDQLNLFLYHTLPNAAWRNRDLPSQVKPGETGQPPLALNLYYLITAYGAGDDETRSHRWLGEAMQTLHDHALLGSQEIRDALPDNDLYEQIERVRITLQPLSLEEMSKLWTTFQTQYRISVAYEASVVLIESRQAKRTPLPVLTIGASDRGAIVRPDVTPPLPPFPTLTSVELPDLYPQPSIRLGERLTLQGYHLDGDSVTVQLNNPRLTQPQELVPQPTDATATEISVQLPNPGDPNDANAPTSTWVAGVHTVAVIVSRAGKTQATNELPFPLVPLITTVSPTSAPPGNVTLTLTCQPKIRPEQRAVLLFGDREVLASPHAAPTETLTFQLEDAIAGEYFVRLRIDGVDSVLITRTADTPPQLVFDPNLQVAIA
jgi:Pvc16 N-terminal domain